MSVLKYRAEIDGLRAIAVGAVVLYHAGVPLIHGGFVGVDIFFVISGYLITGILHREMSESSFSFGSFYERRIRRLLPALFTVIVATGIVGWFVLLPEDFATFGSSVIATLLFFANIFFWYQSSNYFDAPAHLKPLLHTWSLGVEEQFYILFPIFLWLVMRFLPRQALPALIITGFLASFALSLWGVANTPVAAFYLLPTRAWELLMGSALALGIVPAISLAWLRESIAAAGLLLIALSIYFIVPEMPFPGWAALPSCLGAAAIIYANTNGTTLAGTLLSLRPVVFIGIISYSLYLVHWPVFVLVGYAAIDPLEPMTIVLCLLASFVLAIMSWRYIERPFRGKCGFLPTRKQIFAAAAGGMLMLGAGAAVIDSLEGLPRRMPDDVARVLVKRQYFGDERHCHMARLRSDDELCARGAPDAPVTFMLVGDSHGGAMAPGIFAAAKEAGKSGLQFTEPGYSPTIGYIKWGEPDKFRILNKRIVEFLRKRDDIEDVFVVVFWRQAVEQNTYWNAAGERVDGTVAVTRGLSALVEMFPERRFILVQAPPVWRNYGYHVEARRRLFGASLEQSFPRADYEEMRSRYATIFAELGKRPNVAVLDPADIYCDAETCPGVSDGTLLYFDTNHISASGARRIVPAFLEFWTGKPAG